MKRLLTIGLVFIQVHLFANMANPVIEGTIGSEPFVGQFADVLNEELFIKIDENFEHAFYTVKYHISSSKDGFQIPFLFYASEYLNSFSVKIDGMGVPVKDMPYDYDLPENAKFKDFAFFFESTSDNDNYSIPLEYSPNGRTYVTLENMIYFEADISEGEHLIEVKYKANRWTDTSDWVNEYSFRYALSPAKYWKSFGTLSVHIDDTDFDGELTTNLGEPSSINLNAVSTWEFDHLPKDFLQIEYIPKIGTFAKFLIKISPNGLAYISGIILAILHLLILIWSRKRNPIKRFSLIVLIGSLLVPFLFFISSMYYYEFIDSLIGVHAGRSHGYTFLVIALYPIVMPVYGLVFWLIDRFLKDKYSLEKG